VAADVYTRIITTASQWLEMISLEDIFARYYLATDIDFTDVTYDVSTNAGVGQGFSGELNGGYPTLSNIKVTGSGKQSLLGGANCAKVKNIAFQGVKYTSNNACGICDSLVQHKNVSSLEGLTFLGDEVLINGKVIEGAFKSPGMELVVFPAIFSNIILDAQFVGHSNAAFCKDFYGGTVNNVYVNMTHADDEAFSDADFAFCQNLYIWNTPNAVSNVFVYIEKGVMNSTPARLLGSFELPMSNVGYYTDQMQINYQAYKALDGNVFDVRPTGIPTFVKKSI
jgi:hypothetical protein